MGVVFFIVVIYFYLRGFGLNFKYFLDVLRVCFCLRIMKMRFFKKAVGYKSCLVLFIFVFKRDYFSVFLIFFKLILRGFNLVLI